MIKLENKWYKIKIASEQEGYAVQEKLFSMGCVWGFNGSRLRKIRSICHIGLTPDQKIFMSDFDFSTSDATEIKITDLFNRGN